VTIAIAKCKRSAEIVTMRNSPCAVMVDHGVADPRIDHRLPYIGFREKDW
jgi:hypothetical protein